MADVFLSYARADLEKAERVKAGLEAAGLTVFFDVEGLDGGDVFPDVLDREVKGAGAVVSLWSPHALSRPWVKQECSIGLKRKCLIPAAIEPLGELDVPVAFEGLQVVDLTGFHGNTETPEWRQLMRALARTLKRPELAPTPAAVFRPGAMAPVQGPGGGVRFWMVALGGLAIAAMGIVARPYVFPDAGEVLDQPAEVAGDVAAEEPVVEEAAAEAEFTPPAAGVTELQPGTECGDVEARVYFDFDRSDLNMWTVSILEEALQYGFACDLVEVRVEAHDDLVNSPSYAEGLSQRRANAVADLLAARGVSREAIMTVGYGSSQPLQPGQRSPANRRAVVVFDYEDATPG